VPFFRDALSEGKGQRAESKGEDFELQITNYELFGFELGRGFVKLLILNTITLYDYYC